MSENPWRILIIEDTPEMADTAKREIEDAFDGDDDIRVTVDVVDDFDEGSRRVARGECDIVVLDVRRGDGPPGAVDEMAEAVSGGCEAGEGVFRDIRDARFVPVVFWTALPEHVAHAEMPPLVAVLAKDAFGLLPAAIRQAIDSRAVSAMSNLETRVAEILRRHMWLELGPHWDEYMADADESVIAHSLIATLARSLDAELEADFRSRASDRYIYPAPGPLRRPGDVLRETQGERVDWWVILTPACDLAQGKADWITVARAAPLNAHPTFAAWEASERSKTKSGDLKKVLKATAGRYRFLPRFRDIPDLVVDLQEIRSFAKTESERFEAIASLSSPFAESLLAQHSHYAGRVGVPDLNVDAVWERLAAAPDSAD